MVEWNLRDTRRPVSVLRGKGACLWDAALSADDRYLGFRDQRNPDAADPNQRARGPWRVFDLEQRDWAAAGKFKPLARTATLAGWRIVPDARSRLLWYAVDPEGTKHPLPTTVMDEAPTCYTFLPRSAGEPVRLAVGHYWGLSIYSLSEKTGARRIRLCVGHQGETTALGVSAGGKWLVSASRDQTIAAWDLSARPSGTELGATFRLRDGRLLVQDVDLFSPAWEAGLLAGDEVVLLAVHASKVFDRDGSKEFGKALGKAEDCLAHLKAPVPGRELYFGVRRGKAGKPVAMLTTLKHRPLWRFFPTAGRAPEWVLWMWRHHYYDTSPHGDFFVGWHVNNPAGVEKTPSFYRAEQFRGLFHQPGVIDLLIGSRDVGKTLTRAGVELAPTDFRKVEPHKGRLLIDGKEVGDGIVEVKDRDVEVAVIADPNSDNPDRAPCAPSCG